MCKAPRETTIYVGVDDILRLFADLFGCTDQQAGDQLRSRSGLEGALARPEWYAEYTQADLALQAAVLAHGIAEGQHFVEGNKRTALAAMLLFLDQNGYALTASQPERADWILDLSAGLRPEILAQRLRATLIAVDR
jgi:death-on-curing family protein